LKKLQNVVDEMLGHNNIFDFFSKKIEKNFFQGKGA